MTVHVPAHAPELSDSPAMPDNEARIVAYWNRRASLNEVEWDDFYRRVTPLLMRTRLPPKYADPRERRDLVNLFMVEKVFLNAKTSQAGDLHSAFALHGFLKRFAESQARAMPDEQMTDEAPEIVAAATPARHQHAELLAEAGIDVPTVMHSANHFIASLDDGERALLSQHTCADQEQAETVQSIALRTAMGTSYHYKAKMLGLTRSKGDTHKNYEKTKLGRWLLAAGAKLNSEWREELAVLLILLCMQAQLHGDEQ